MLNLMLMRHAKSDWKSPGLADHERPLNKRGRRAAPFMARYLRDHDAMPEIVLASSAVRAQETAQLMLAEWSEQIEIITAKALYLASPQEIAAEIQSLPDQWTSVLVIGHNPGMCALLCHLAGEGIEMPTAAVGVFRSQLNSWQNAVHEGHWELAEYWKPRELE